MVPQKVSEPVEKNNQKFKGISLLKHFGSKGLHFRLYFST